MKPISRFQDAIPALIHRKKIRIIGDPAEKLAVYLQHTRLISLELSYSGKNFEM